MYWTLLRKPSQRAYLVNRKVNENDGNLPYTAQISDNTQECIGTLLCATHADMVRVLRYFEQDLACFSISNGTAPMQEGLDRFQGTITGLRYLRTDDQDDGAYEINPGV